MHYSDTLPSSYQTSGAAEMSKQGNIIKRTQSETERRAEAERQAEQARIQQEQQKQAQLDRALTSTYTTEAEIDLGATGRWNTTSWRSGERIFAPRRWIKTWPTCGPVLPTSKNPDAR